MSWKRGRVEVQRVGTALWIALDGQTTLIDCPDGTGPALRGRSLRRLWLTNGRLARVSGMLGVLARTVPDEVCFPLSDERGALVAEAWQRGWEGQVVLDAIQPGSAVVHDGIQVRTQGLRSASPAMGLRWEHPDAVVAYLPRCAPDAAARRLCHDVDLLVTEPGFHGIENLGLAASTEIWAIAVGEA